MMPETADQINQWIRELLSRPDSPATTVVLRRRLGDALAPDIASWIESASRAERTLITKYLRAEADRIVGSDPASGWLEIAADDIDEGRHYVLA